MSLCCLSTHTLHELLHILAHRQSVIPTQNNTHSYWNVSGVPYKRKIQNSLSASATRGKICSYFRCYKYVCCTKWGSLMFVSAKKSHPHIGYLCTDYTRLNRKSSASFHNLVPFTTLAELISICRRLFYPIIHPPFPKSSTSIPFITARKRSLGQCNNFTPVCHSVHRGGGYVVPGGYVVLQRNYIPPEATYPPRTTYPPKTTYPPRTT